VFRGEGKQNSMAMAMAMAIAIAISKFNSNLKFLTTNDYSPFGG
jgi:hypothetical protein